MSEQIENIAFRSNLSLCKGNYYKAQQRVEGTRYGIVMAHGLGSVKEMRLPAYAERFAEAGFDVLIFDYRHFGESEGYPRQILDVNKQVEDWLAAVDFMQTQKGFNKENLVLWGTSLSGGHVLTVASQLPQLAGVVSQVPHTDALASAQAAGIVHGFKMAIVGFADLMRDFVGCSPIYLNSSGRPGDLAFMTAAGEHEGYIGLVPEGLQFDRRIAARFALGISTYNPGKHIKNLKMPTLIQVALKDVTTPAKPTIRACDKSGVVELKSYNLGHFEPYVGDAFETFVSDQLVFLNKIKQKKSKQF